MTSHNNIIVLLYSSTLVQYRLNPSINCGHYCYNYRGWLVAKDLKHKVHGHSAGIVRVILYLYRVS